MARLGASRADTYKRIRQRKRPTQIPPRVSGSAGETLQILTGAGGQRGRKVGANCGAMGMEGSKGAVTWMVRRTVPPQNSR